MTETFKIKGLDKLNRAFDDMAGRSANMEPAMKVIGVNQIRSIQKNFTQGGRPKKWPESKRALDLTSSNQAKGSSRTGKTLSKRGIFKNSWTSKPSRTGVRIGTNFVGAAAHHHGMTINVPEIKPKRAKFLRFVLEDGTVVFTKKVKAHKVKMPKREVAMFHPEDIKRAKRVIVDHVLKGEK